MENCKYTDLTEKIKSIKKEADLMFKKDITIFMDSPGADTYLNLFKAYITIRELEYPSILDNGYASGSTKEFEANCKELMDHLELNYTYKGETND